MELYYQHNGKRIFLHQRIDRRVIDSTVDCEIVCIDMMMSWLETLHALLALCGRKSAITLVPTFQRASNSIQSFYLFFDVIHNKLLDKLSSCQWFETPKTFMSMG